MPAQPPPDLLPIPTHLRRGPKSRLHRREPHHHRQLPDLPRRRSRERRHRHHGRHIPFLPRLDIRPQLHVAGHLRIPRPRRRRARALPHAEARRRDGRDDMEERRVAAAAARGGRAAATGAGEDADSVLGAVVRAWEAGGDAAGGRV